MQSMQSVFIGCYQGITLRWMARLTDQNQVFHRAL